MLYIETSGDDMDISPDASPKPVETTNHIHSQSVVTLSQRSDSHSQPQNSQNSAPDANSMWGKGRLQFALNYLWFSSTKQSC